ncbi:glycosyltransferase family 4 protein [Paracraurococcus ruber]|uniref:Glycosyltransferase subfamily 4-like N-terminal domain-containing protein n=1 Tax=Paracraurococcus ruber TaxID=77675 RepID=A0ABS1CUS6_9PROT|nr:glycosyltransferase family 4 protein [Paracraurococcus ruber]MBK1658098.1 hypothetical protein [Paracraurococcus ruber]TDG32351.1 glycosyltransferase WbuB [Paracraurococcus ruber]
MRIAVHDYAGHPFEFDLSRALAARGHTVRHFWFGGDQGPKGDTERRPEDPAGFSVVPVQISMAYSKDRFLRRVLGDVLYGRAAARMIAAFEPDLVISANTPLEAQGAIQAAARARRAPFVFWLQDYYSVAIRRLLGHRWRGAGKVVAARYERMEASLLRRSEGVVLISDDFRRYLPSSVAGSDRVCTIPNWAPLSALPLRPKDNAWARRHGFAGHFAFLYTGTLALKHNPALLAGLAARMATDRAVKVGVVSSGVGFERLRAAAPSLDNMAFLPPQPMPDFPDVLASADVLVAVLEEDAGEFSVPSKVLSYLCAGRPILLAAPRGNLATRIVEEAGAGLCVAPGDAAGFEAAAVRLREDAALRQRCGAAGRAYAEAHFDIGRIVQRFESFFATIN